jgi:hypothetical protein
MLNKGICELEVLGEKPEVDVKLGEKLDPLVKVLEFRTEDVKLPQEGKDRNVDDSKSDEIMEGSTNVVEAISVVFNHLEETGAGGVLLLVKLKVASGDPVL